MLVPQHHPHWLFSATEHFPDFKGKFIAKSLIVTLGFFVCIKIPKRRKNCVNYFLDSSLEPGEMRTEK